MSAVAGAAEVHPETISASVEGRSPRQIFWMRFRQDRAALVGGIVVAMLLLLAIFAGVISQHIIGHDPNTVYDDMTDDYGIPKGPNSSFWFGADASGRDLFVRVIYGARTSLLVAGIATTISMTVGVTVGVIAGYYRGFVDTIVMRLSRRRARAAAAAARDRHRRRLRLDAEGCLGGARAAGPRRS